MTFGVHLAQLIREPPLGFRTQQWQTGSEVDLILRPQVARFIEQLHLDPHARYAIVGHKQVVALPANPVVTSAEPLISFDFCEHNLQLPRVHVTTMAPDVMDADGEIFVRHPRP